MADADIFALALLGSLADIRNALWWLVATVPAAILLGGLAHAFLTRNRRG